MKTTNFFINIIKIKKVILKYKSKRNTFLVFIYFFKQGTYLCLFEFTIK
jgi:hypothetical protein